MGYYLLLNSLLLSVLWCEIRKGSRLTQKSCSGCAGVSFCSSNYFLIREKKKKKVTVFLVICGCLLSSGTRSYSFPAKKRLRANFNWGEGIKSIRYFPKIVLKDRISQINKNNIGL